MELYNRTKANLKGKHVSFYEVNWYDLEELICKIYSIDYEFQADVECDNDTSHDFNIKKEVFNDWDRDRLKDFIDTNGRKTNMTRVLLKDMCNKGILSPGNYLIQISY